MLNIVALCVEREVHRERVFLGLLASSSGEAHSQIHIYISRHSVLLAGRFERREKAGYRRKKEL